MSEAKGPKVAVPEELLEELEAPEQAGDGGNGADAAEATTLLDEPPNASIHATCTSTSSPSRW